MPASACARPMPLTRLESLHHLAALSPEDRHLRFCGTLSDAAIAEHVAGLDRRPGFALAAFAGPLWQGPFHGSGPIKAFAELVVSGQTAELGLSVDADRRRAGIGTYLIQTAARLLAPRGVARILALTLARNTAMIRLGEACGAGIERDGADVMIDFSVAQLDAAYRARRTAQSSPPRRTPTVTAAPIAPRNDSPGVPTARLATSQA
jgi:GNAT superfamily N-acetyltransferase